MDITKAHIRRQVVTALNNTIREGSDALGKEEMISVVHEILADLDGENGRECTYKKEGSKKVLRLTYCSALALEREWDILTDICGMLVEVDSEPPKMEELIILVGGKGVRDSVELCGRVVQNTAQGAALELFPPDEEQKRDLKLLLKKMEIAKETLHQQSSAEQMHGPAMSEVSVVEPVSGAASGPSSEVHYVRAEPVGIIPMTDRVENEWEVSQNNISSVLLEATRVEGYGVLEIRTRQQKTQLVIHHGDLIDVRREPESSAESLKELLITAGRATVEEVERAQEMADEQMISLGDALVDLQLMTHSELLVAVRTRLIFLLRQVWQMERGEATLFLLHKRPIQHMRSSANLLEEIVRYVTEKFSTLAAPDLEELSRKFEGDHLKRRAEMPVAIEEMGFSEAVERFVDVLLADSWPLAELHRVSSLSRSKVLQTLLVLDELDFLERDEIVARRWEETEVNDLYLRFDSSNYFELFGVHWTTYDKKVEEGYKKLLKKLDVPEEVRQKKKAEIDEMREGIEEAYKVLSSRRKRRAYRDQQIDNFAQTGAIQIYEKKADTFKMQGNIDGLVDCLKRIIELQPTNQAAKRDLVALREWSE